MIDVLLIALTGVGLILSAVGWSTFGAVFVSGNVTRDARLPKALFVLGDPKLIWASLLLLASSGSLLASRQLDNGSNISVLALAAAYAFFWCVLAALITRLRKQGHTESESDAGYISWPALMLSLGAIGLGIFVGMALLAIWVKIGS
ncbi:hypothetical protein [Arthrobacter sp. ERGS1:01]|uniref:hypothetical protein n=1 Tax=Arthrobacter sp. ERGS1:01 TaxID=1704044 RepID=UPI000AE0CF63|nr:hypothetical protein [Arthrobacter sp. ERGS1:01]